MATAQENRDQNYMTTARNLAEKLWDAHNGLLELQAQWNAQDYGNTGAFDGTGSNEGITSAMVGAVVFDSANAIKTVMDAGSATNITEIL